MYLALIEPHNALEQEKESSSNNNSSIRYQQCFTRNNVATQQRKYYRISKKCYILTLLRERSICPNTFYQYEYMKLYGVVKTFLS